MTEAMRERASARKVLIVLVGLLVTILGLQGLASVRPGGFEAFAQTTPSPTPTGPSIQFLNPSKKTSLELSDRDDGSAGPSKFAYHIVAWTHLAPSGAGVSFKYDPEGTAPEIEIGRATQISGDSWEFFWDIPDSVADAGALTGTPPRTNPVTGVLRAILFDSAGTEVARDEENVTVNNKNRRPANPTTGDPGDPFTVEDQGNTVEISYPSNAGEMGFFGSPDGTYTGIVDVTFSNVSPPQSTQNVRAFYSVDPPGTEPNFILCGTETAAAAADGVRCTLASGDRPTRVQAVAAVPTDKTQEPAAAAQADDLDAADGHRVFGYEQDPDRVTFAPSSDTEDPNKCNDPALVATVLDTEDRKVAGANIDIHAEGPTDNLFFDDSGDQSSTHQAPDQGNHARESGVDCESTSAQPQFAADVQGDHERQTTPDVKHIESTVATSSAKTGGTDDTGSFRFKLLSRDPGGTQITAFVDEDFNDRHCSEEASGDASIGWGTGAPSATGVDAEETVCPKPTPGVTPGTTPTSTLTSTATATATSTSTATPTGSPTTTGPTTSRTVAFSADKGRTVAGRQVTFSGQVLSSDASCTDNEFIQIQRRVLGTTTFEDYETAQTDSQGRFTFTRRVVQGADYVATANAHDNCRDASSGEVTVLVKVRMQILASDKSPERGDRIRFKSSVRPQHDGTELLLQRKKGRRWVTVERDELNRRSIAQFVIDADFKKRTFRTRWKSQDAEHETNNSRPITIKTTR
jgi:hypothetical protein